MKEPYGFRKKDIAEGKCCRACGVYFEKANGKIVYCSDCVKFLTLKGTMPLKYKVSKHRDIETKGLRQAHRGLPPNIDVGSVRELRKELFKY